MKRNLCLAAFFITAQLSFAAEMPSNHPSVQDALKASGAAVDEIEPTYANTGTVINTIHSNNYTYIELVQDNKQIWLAAPKVELEKGTVIHYGQGITMVDFYSNGLKREFPEIYFVDRVKIAD